MSKSNKMDKNHKELLNIFLDSFGSVYKYLSVSQKSYLQKYIPTIYNKWYYSSLLMDTILSPANIFAEEYSEKDIHYSTSAFNINVDKNSNGVLKYKFKIVKYSQENHPIINDLKLVVSHCAPDASLTQDNTFEYDTEKYILNNISIQDMFYLEYLIELAFQLNLIETIPSIYSNKVQASCIWLDFFKKSSSDILDSIIKASISVSTLKLSENVYLGRTGITEKMITSFLKKPSSTDSLFKKIYDSIGLDLDKIMSLSDDADITIPESLLITSTFYFGIIIDKWFFSIFGTYLKLIQPIYFETYNFKEELHFLCSTFEANSGIIPDIFSPCTCYSITPLGEIIFTKGKKTKNIQELPKIVDIDTIITTIKTDMDNKAYKDLIEEEEFLLSDIYTFKIKQINNIRCWKTVEVEGLNSLHEFSEELFFIFGYDESDDYRYTINDIRGYTHVYVAENLKKSMLKSSSITINELNMIKNQKFLFTATPDRSLRFEIELIKITSKNSNINYPRIVKQSKYLMEEDNRE